MPLNLDKKLFLETLKKYSYFTDSVNWKEFEEELFSVKEINLETINELLKKIDAHSFAQLNVGHHTKAPQQSVSKVETKLLPNDISYLKLDGFFSPDDTQGAYIEYYEAIVEGLNSIKDSQELILDLTDNYGGNMYPCFAALAPLFDTKTIGHFKYAYKEEKDGWIIKFGGVYCGDKKMFEKINPNTYSFRKIAILISDKTASSGEAISIGFKGQSNTKFFGVPTAGYTTGNESYKNEDIIIWLSTCVMQDRYGVSYDSSVHPDLESETPIAEASSWLST